MTYCVASARRAVGDSGRRQKVIKTIHGRGYSFIAPVVERSALFEAIASEPTHVAEVDPVTSPIDPERPTSSEPVPPPHHPLQITAAGGRRQLTVMWCNLTATSVSTAWVDPEEMHEVILYAQQQYETIILRLEGYIAQHLGHGLLVYFGFPQAHEEDAHRAVRTALDMVRAVAQINQELRSSRGTELSVCIGIHTGLVVMGEVRRGTGEEQVALGEAPRIATALASLSRPQSILVSPETLKLVEGYFVCESLGLFYFDELAQSIVVHRVESESAAQSRIEAATPGRLTSFVGREQEMGLLQERFEQAATGAGQVVLLSGEAGIGKSRLLHALDTHMTSENLRRIECRCSPYYQHSAFHPIIDYLQRTWEWHRYNTPEDKIGKIETAVETVGLVPGEAVSLFARLLAVPLPGDFSIPSTTPQQQKQRTMAALLAWLLHAESDETLCLVVEDLHWADPSTLDLLHLIVEQAPAMRLLVLLTSRPDFQPTWGMRSYIAYLVLSRLSQVQVSRMVLELTGGKPLPDEICQQIVARTDGVPLFVEEMTRMVLESEFLKEKEDHYQLVDSQPSLSIPSTLHDSLMARLDRLEVGKQTAQIGAVIGREFSYDLMRAVSDLDGDLLQDELAELLKAELIYQRGLRPHHLFLFKHALIQEAAYESLLHSTRRQYHRQIAEVLEATFPG